MSICDMRKTGLPFSSRWMVLSLVLFAALLATANAGVSGANIASGKAVDLGPLSVRSAATPISVTIALALRDPEGAQNLLNSIYTPGDPQFHKFLTAGEFVARFAPTQADIARVVSAMGTYGLRVEQTTATTLRVTGLPADMERAFAVSLHAYQVSGRNNAPGYTFYAPLSHPTVPAEISAAVSGVAGLDSRPRFHPRSTKISPRLAASASASPSATGDAAGSYTVADFANFYDVTPLYNQGLSGAGRTLGILTFAAFTPSDAFAYWKALGLHVAKDRIQIVNIDGGSGAPSDDSGSLETTLDVEQSGGIAPGAKIIVYEAPNTDQAFVDVFAAAIDANEAETFSISWGDWEWFQNLENSPVTDPITGNTVSTLRAIHELLQRAAIQGQTPFAASGDGGAYDVNNDLGCDGPYSSTAPNSCSVTLSVDYPASDPLMTAAGGTTLPGLQEYCLNAKCTSVYKINIRHESVWGWDYLIGLCKALGYNPISCGIFPGGSGGGVSIEFQEPAYQFGLRGVQLSQPGQLFQAGSGFAGDFVLEYQLPALYPGRNVPDVSFNADPETGYVIYYTSNKTGFSKQTFWGGTSFVGPQLNGVSALIGQDVHRRIGFLNVPLYALAQLGQAYGGSGAPLNVISYGDNWFYHGRNGYSPAVGLGTLDVANFANALSSTF